MSRTSRYAHALPEAQPVVEGPFETVTAAAPGTTGRVVVVAALVVVVVTAALVVVVAPTTVVVVTPALVVEVAAGSAGVSADEALIVVELVRRVVEVVDAPTPPVALVAPEEPVAPVGLACLLDRLVVVVLSDPAAGSPELPPEHPTRSIETAAIARIGARRCRLFPAIMSAARSGLMPIP
ncbi:unannotated protein [freshwater metagenome]|uniref:Unannotated protein n=1 Tax=freshwater metagenome TaxID=449393 RepID=A0A6J7JSJ9_9ZZZZ|nr:hypothetical protein [Actinomycetota bacterium]